MAFDPDAQLGDWYSWLTTQAGHSALVGVPAALILLPWFGPFLAPLIVAAAYLLLWEIAVQRVGAGWKDALEDTACTAAGAPLPTADQVRARRNALLAACDWTQLPDAPVDAAAWSAYRQALRDLTAQDGFPAAVVWPEQP